MTANKVFFVINKYSGTGFQSKIEGRIIDACARLKLEAISEYTQRKGHATELAREAASAGIPRIFAMGGDGTVNEVAQGIVGTSSAMGILPKGSGNGLSRHLKIPLQLPHALKLLDQYQVIDMDVLRVNGKLSVNISGIGFDAHVAGKFGKDGKRGLFGYIKLAMKEFLSYKEFDTHAFLDGKPVTSKFFVIALANSSQLGNNALVAPSASVRDGAMEVCFIKKVPVYKMLDFTTKMFTGKIEQSSFVNIMKATQFKAEFSNPLPYHIDGEAYPAENKFIVEIQPGALKIIVPVHTGKIL